MRSRLLLDLLFTPLMLATGFAGVGDAGESAKSVVIGTPTARVGTCALGVTTGGADCHCYDPLIDPIVMVLTDLSASSCPGCGETLLTTAHVQLGFATPRDVAVTVRIVAPDRSTERCPAREYVLSPTAPGPHDFALPLADDCCITEDAILEVRFIQGVFSHEIVCGGFELGRSYLVTRDGFGFDPRSWDCGPSFPTPCAWGGGRQLTDEPVFYVEGDCCTATGTRPSTWGLLKTQYR